MLRIFANYQKISEFTNGIDDEESPNGYDGDGISFKAKLIGMEDLPIDQDEKTSLDALIRLKSIVRVRGEHKQKIQWNLSFNGVQVIDESTKVELASHEIRRISFVIMDPRDLRTFGYIYNTTDGRHQFWAIKTERLAQSAVFAMKDIFEEVYRKLNLSDSTEPQKDPITSTNEATVSSQSSSDLIPPTTQTTTTPLFDDTWGGNSLAIAPQTFPTFEQQSTSNTDPWGFSKPVPPLKQSAPHVDSPVNLFSLPPPPLTRRSTTTQPSLASTVVTDDLFSLFTTAPPTSSMNDCFFTQPIQQTSSVSQQQSIDFFNLPPPSFINSPPTTNLLGEFDLFNGFSSGSTAATTTNDPFFSPPSSAKSFQ